jgi:hypothetical protein
VGNPDLGARMQQEIPVLIMMMMIKRMVVKSI